MGWNLTSLSALDPTTLVIRIAATVGVIAVLLGTGFVGGCTYKKHEVEADKLAESENARRLEHKDATEGSVAAEAFHGSQAGIDKNTKDVLDATPSKPIYIVKYKPATCPTQETVKLKEPINEDAPPVLLTGHAMRMYDLSIQPGNSELRAGTYDETKTIPLDEGFKLAEENNGACAKVADQLNKLLDRIEQKRKTFSSSTTLGVN
jgi:hypothetical protein